MNDDQPYADDRHRIVVIRPALPCEMYTPDTPWRRQDTTPSPVPELDSDATHGRSPRKGSTAELTTATHIASNGCRLHCCRATDPSIAKWRRSDSPVAHIVRPQVGLWTTAAAPGLSTSTACWWPPQCQRFDDVPAQFSQAT
jgi:hypothetical protein